MSCVDLVSIRTTAHCIFIKLFHLLMPCFDWVCNSDDRSSYCYEMIPFHWCLVLIACVKSGRQFIVNETNVVIVQLCAHKYRLNSAWKTAWGWWDDTLLQTHNSKFEPWRPQDEHATSQSRRFPQYWIITSEQGRNILFLWNFKARVGFEPAISDIPSRQI